MTIGSLLFIGAIVVIAIFGVTLYNGLVALKHGVAKAWANIDVLLKQRHDELPKLVEVCKQYKQFEQDTLQRVIEARSRVQTATIGRPPGQEADQTHESQADHPDLT